LVKHRSLFEMEKTFLELSERIDKYFSEISDEQLQLDLEEAGYEFYKNVLPFTLEKSG